MSREDRIARKHRLLGDDYLLPSEREALGEEGEFAEDELDRADRFAREMDNSDQLTQKSRLIQAKQQAISQQAQFTRNNPPSILAGTIGGQQRVFSAAYANTKTFTGALSGQPIQVANWTGDDSETTPVSVAFAPVGQYLNNPTLESNGQAIFGSVRPYGIVQFGTRGFSPMMEVDIGTGCQFTIPASSVTLQVALETTPGIIDPITGFTMLLSGMLSFHTTQKDTPITRTSYVDGLADGTVQFISVPPFARRVWFFRGNSATTAFALQFLVGPVGSQSVYDVNIAATDNMSSPVNISSDVLGVVVKNNSGGGLAITGRLIFELGV